MRTTCAPRRRTSRYTAGLVALALFGAACGGSSDDAADGPSETTRASGVPAVLIADGKITDEAIAAATKDGDVQGAVVEAVVSEVLALEPNDQLAVLGEVSRRFELELARASGLESAVGDAAATERALDGAWDPIRAGVDAIGPALEAGELESVFGRGRIARPGQADATSAAGTGAVGLMMGMMGLGMMAEPVVTASNTAKPGENETAEVAKGAKIGGSLEESSVALEFDGDQDGVAVKFTASLIVHPCPDPDGRFDAKVRIDIHTSKGQTGSNAKIDLELDGQVDDNAKVANVDAKTRTEWAEFANAKGQYLDFTSARTSGTSTFAFNRSGGTVTAPVVNMAVMMSALFAAMVEQFVVRAAESGWSSGRCVELKVTPSDGPEGLEPAAVVDVRAEPRSKVDGKPTGGNVTATLTAGGASVEPDGSPVPADADSTYTAPDEEDKTGTVHYESRSRRGVGKADVRYSTAKPAAYRVVGGLQDWKIDQVVCDVMAPFTLTGEIGAMQLSGGLSGTYVFDGMFSSHYEGTYEISLPDGPGKPGTMVGTGSGSVAGQAGSGTENYALTPTTC